MSETLETQPIPDEALPVLARVARVGIIEWQQTLFNIEQEMARRGILSAQLADYIDPAVV